MGLDSFYAVLSLFLTLTTELKVRISHTALSTKPQDSFYLPKDTFHLLSDNDEWSAILIPDHLSIAHIQVHCHGCVGSRANILGIRISKIKQLTVGTVLHVQAGGVAVSELSVVFWCW